MPDVLDMKQAMNNPKDTFGTPESVLSDPRLDLDAKRAILKNWKQDARELAVAEEEGMTGGEQSLLQRVSRALETITDDCSDSTGAVTKHGGGATGDENPD